MKCPYCAEEIQELARKCKHCGEWLDKAINPMFIDKEEIICNSSSGLILYDCALIDENKNRTFEYIPAHSKEELQQLLIKKYGNSVKIDKDYPIIECKISKLSCPKCGYNYSKCKRDIGFVVFVIIFISFGLGLIMLPFLPYRCECTICGHMWKS